MDNSRENNTIFPSMVLRIYSLTILILDIIMLLFGTFFAILNTIYRVFIPPPLKSLDGQVALVAGAEGGIGRALTIQLCELGATVACIDINLHNCESTVQMTSRSIGVAKMYICNIRNEKEVTDTVNIIRSELGEITMLFNCCSIPSPTKLLERTLQIKSTIDLTITSYFWLLESVLPSMERAGRGHIVFLSSVAGLSSTTIGKNRLPLSAAQFAIQGLAEYLHTEMRHINNKIRITSVHIYPFIMGAEEAGNIRFRLPSYFGTIDTKEAATQILNGVRRNYAEFSIPGYLLYTGHIIRLFPKKVSFMVRDLLDAGAAFG